MKCASIGTYSDVVSMCIAPVRVKRKNSINEVHTYALMDSCSQGTFALDKLNFTQSHYIANKDIVGFLQILEEGAKLVNDHYDIPLSFRRVDVQLPNNKVQAEKRLVSLKKKMARNNKFKDNHIKLMKEL